MANLVDDVRELFAELDGYRRYEAAIEICARRTVHNNYERNRENARVRYRLDRQWRDRLWRYRRNWRHEHGRPLKQYGPLAPRHGTHTGYKRNGCRCRACTDAMAQYQREWRARKARAA